MNWFNEINGTNLKTVTGCIGFLALIFGVVTMEWAGKHFNEVLFLECAALITAWAGISYQQFAKKRETTIITPPQTTAENAIPDPAPAPTRPVPMPTGPVFNQAVAQQVADQYEPPEPEGPPAPRLRRPRPRPTYAGQDDFAPVAGKPGGKAPDMIDVPGSGG